MRDRAVLSGARALNTPVRDNALHYIIVIKYTRAARGQVDWLQADTHTRTHARTHRQIDHALKVVSSAVCQTVL